MRISIFGLGYVGAVSAARLSSDGHHVLGVDKNQTKIDLIEAGRTPIIEDDVDVLIENAHKQGSLSATSDAAAAVRDTDLSIVCVGTPSENNGNLNLAYVRNVCREIGEALAHKDCYHIVLIRSTILPGRMRDIVIPIPAESSGKRAGEDFGVCFNPEFLREGTAVKDYYDPPKTVSASRIPGPGMCSSACTRTSRPLCFARSARRPRWSSTWTTLGTCSRWALPTRSARSPRRWGSTATTS